MTLLENRPGSHNFMLSEKLQNFTKATNVRIRLLRPKTFQEQFLDLQGKENKADNAGNLISSSVTRRVSSLFFNITDYLF